MMKFSFLPLLLFCISLNAQYKRLNPKSVKPEELELEISPLDSTAKAFYLYDLGESFIDLNPRGDLEIIHKRELRIKNLSSDVDDIANWSIPLGKNKEREESISGIKVTVYHLVNGKIEKEKMDRDVVEIQAVHPYLNMAKFVIPNVQKGSIIDVEYQIRSPFFYGFFPWKFQHDIPVAYSEYTIKIPEFLTYNTNIQGFFPVDKYDQNVEYKSYVIRNKSFQYSLTAPVTTDMFTYNSTNTVMTYVAKDIPAYKEEPFVGTIENFTSKIIFSLNKIHFRGEAEKNISNDWSGVDKSYSESDKFGKFISNKREAEDILRHTLSGEESPEAKLHKIYYKIREQVRWNNSFRDYSSQSSPYGIWLKGEGSSADLNLLLVLLCREAGFKSFPILSSTRRNGYVFTNNPSEMQFNHVIAGVELDSTLILMDLSGLNNPPGLLPYHCLNGNARILDTESRWINLCPQSAPKDKYVYNLKISPEGKLSGQGIWQLADHTALNFMERIASAQNNPQLLRLLRKDYPQLDIQTFKTDSMKQNDLKIAMEFEDKTGLEKAGNRLIVKTNPFKEILQNPFTDDIRYYPIDLGTPINKVCSFTLEIPEGYHYSAGPKPLKVSLPENKGAFLFQVIPVGNMVQINYSFKINNNFYTNADYPYLRELYALAESKINEPIIFEKD